MEWVRTPQALEDLISYLEKRRGTIPNYQQRQRGGLWIASTRVEKFNDWSVSERCKGRGMSWTPLDPVPTTATRLPPKSNGVVGHCPVWCYSPRNCSRPGTPGKWGTEKMPVAATRNCVRNSVPPATTVHVPDASS